MRYERRQVGEIVGETVAGGVAGGSRKGGGGGVRKPFVSPAVIRKTNFQAGKRRAELKTVDGGYPKKKKWRRSRRRRRRSGAAASGVLFFGQAGSGGSHL